MIYRELGGTASWLNQVVETVVSTRAEFLHLARCHRRPNVEQHSHRNKP